MDDSCHPLAEKRCEATKANIPRLHSASSADGVTDNRALASIHREYVDSKRPSSGWARS